MRLEVQLKMLKNHQKFRPLLTGLDVKLKDIDNVEISAVIGLLISSMMNASDSHTELTRKKSLAYFLDHFLNAIQGRSFPSAADFLSVLLESSQGDHPVKSVLREYVHALGDPVHFISAWEALQTSATNQTLTSPANDAQSASRAAPTPSFSSVISLVQNRASSPAGVPTGVIERRLPASELVNGAAQVPKRPLSFTGTGQPLGAATDGPKIKIRRLGEDGAPPTRPSNDQTPT